MGFLEKHKKNKAMKTAKAKLRKNLLAEISRLDAEYAESSALAESYNELVSNALYYAIDRDNFITSSLTGVHDNQLSHICDSIDEIRNLSGKDSKMGTTCDGTNAKLKEVIEYGQANFKKVNETFKLSSKQMISIAKTSASGLNHRCNVISAEKQKLEEIYRTFFGDK